jgi:hypothetical protein
VLLALKLIRGDPLPIGAQACLGLLNLSEFESEFSRWAHHDSNRGCQSVSALYLWTKWVHVISSTLLFGTGAGIAFFFLRAHRTRDAVIIAAVSADVVMADAVFTASSVILQPVTGIALALLSGYPLTNRWLELSIVLYVMIGCCWLPVV